MMSSAHLRSAPLHATLLAIVIVGAQCRPNADANGSTSGSQDSDPDSDDSGTQDPSVADQDSTGEVSTPTADSDASGSADDDEDSGSGGEAGETNDDSGSTDSTDDSGSEASDVTSSTTGQDDDSSGTDASSSDESSTGTTTGADDETDDGDDDSGIPAACRGADLDWRSGRKTWFESYPDPDSDECNNNGGCMWAGKFAACGEKKTEAWVMEHNIVAAYPDFMDLRLHDLCLRYEDRYIIVTVYDTCSDNDCSGCCSRNQDGKDQLIDMEKYTNRRWGVKPEGNATISWADLGQTQGPGCD